MHSPAFPYASPHHALTETQLAARWQVSIRTLQSWRRTGLGPIFLKLGNRVSYRLQDVELYERDSLRRTSGERAEGQEASA